jgi:hypothetical protein
MAGRRGAGRIDPNTALTISLDGTSRRLVDERVPTAAAVDQLRELAAGRTDLLAKAAGGMLGGYLGHPLASALALPAAYLLILAGADQDHATLVATADEHRRNSGRSAYSL